MTDTPESISACYDDEHGDPCVPLATAIKLERQRDELAGYICRIKLPIPLNLLAQLANLFPGKNIRMKELNGYLCIFNEKP